jgi:hypothetical protein
VDEHSEKVNTNRYTNVKPTHNTMSLASSDSKSDTKLT